MKDKRRFFTKSTTFDVSYLFDASNNDSRNRTDNIKKRGSFEAANIDE